MGSSEERGTFGVGIAYAEDEVTVDLRGEVDVATAGSLHRLLTTVARGKPDRVVLDLAALDFIDASGLRVIATIRDRLRPGALTLRSPSAFTARTLAIAGLDGLIRTGADSSFAGLGPEQRSGDDSARVVSAPAALVPDVRRAAGLPPHDVVVDAALKLVGALATATVSGADGVSVTLKRGGEFTTVASSDRIIAQMDRDQYAAGEGPCLSAAAEGRWFHVDVLAQEARWPGFVARALEGGVNSILSTPLMVGSEPIGALNIYSHEERAFGSSAQDLAALFATQASAIVADANVDAADNTARLLQDALGSRETINRAQGVLMERRHITGDEAAAVLWRSAQESGILVRQLATDVVRSTRPAAQKGES